MMTHSEPMSARVRVLLTGAAVTLRKPLFPSDLFVTIAVLEVVPGIFWQSSCVMG
jgi:hypothetical protein